MVLFRTGVVGVLGVAVMLGWASLPLLYMAFFLLGTAETLFANASIAVMPAVVPKERLERANGRLFAAELSANQFAGPPLGGALFSVAASLPFLVDAGTFAASAALLLALRGRFRVAPAEGPAGTTLAAEIAEGLAWLLQHRLLLVLGIMLGAGNFTFSATFSVLVLFAQDVLGLGSVGYGVLLAAGGLGGVLGSLLAERVGSRFGTGQALFLVLLVQGPAFAVIALSGNPFVVGAMVAVEALGAFVWNVLTYALRQTLIPEGLLGRVTSAYRLVGVGSGALGAVVGGLLARELGLAAPFWFAAAVTLAVALASVPFINNRAVAEARAASGP